MIIVVVIGVVCELNNRISWECLEMDTSVTGDDHVW